MPALAFVPGVARVAVNMTLAGRGVANVFHVARAGIAPAPLLQADVDAIAAGVRASYASHFMPILVSQLTLGQVIAQDLSSATGPTGVSSGSTNGGDASHGPFPANVAMCISWFVTEHYRGGHPRTYLPGIPSNTAVDATTWASASLTAFTAAASSFRSDVFAIPLGSVSCALGVVRRYRRGVLLTSPEFLPFTGQTIDTRIDTQRRRLGRDR